MDDQSFIETGESIFEIEEEFENESVEEYDIVSSPRDFTPASIVETVEANLMELPLFQRNYVWDIKKASRLIESIILGLPVPELFLYLEGDENSTYKIIDGQQRLLTIYFFTKGRFPKNNASRVGIRSALSSGMKLTELMNDDSKFIPFALDLDNNGEYKESKFNGKTINSLDIDLQIKFRLRRYVRAVVVRQSKPTNDSSSMFEIFNRLNTGGAPLNHQEVRASLYYCPFYAMMVNLNDQPAWRKLLHSKDADIHSNDIELILRSFALLEKESKYISKVISFLNKYSQESKAFSASHITYLSDLFMSFVNACSELEEKAFYRNGRFSKVLFETVFVTICRDAYSAEKCLDEKYKIDQVKFKKLKDDAKFVEFLQAGVAAKDNVINRLNIAKKILL